jgi:hypothetical protein
MTAPIPPSSGLSDERLDRIRELLDEYRHAIHATEWATTEERPEYERKEWAKRWEVFSTIASLLSRASAERTKTP